MSKGFIIFIVFLLPAYPITPQSYREEIKFSPVKIYETIQQLIEKQRYEDIRASLTYLQPILNTIHLKYAVNTDSLFEKAIQQKNKEVLWNAYQQLLFYDMKAIFEEINDGLNYSTATPDELKIWFRYAYSNYLLMEPFLLKNENGFDINQKTKNLFRKANYLFSISSGYIKENDYKINHKLFKEYATEIENNVGM